MAEHIPTMKIYLLIVLLSYLALCLFAQDCGENVDATPDDLTLTSPGYPRNYLNNMDCVYHITAPEGQRVYLTTSTIDGISIEESKLCTKDYILVIDGPSSTGQVITRACKFHISVLSTGRHMTLVFHSDGDTTDRGFRLLYRSIVNKEECPRQALSAYNDDSAVLSPFFPSAYPNNTECEWQISAPQDYVVYIEVESSSLQRSEDCDRDYVQVFDAAHKNGGFTLGKWCGTVVPSPIQSPGIFMTIVFHSDSQISDRGFRILYSARPKSEIDNPDPPKENKRNLAVGVIAGVIVLLVVIVTVGCTVYLRARKRRSSIVY